MALAIVERVKQALNGNGPSLRQSEVLALVACTEQLWAQAGQSQRPLTSDRRREYMRLYMRQWRAQRRAQAGQAQHSAD